MWWPHHCPPFFPSPPLQSTWPCGNSRLALSLSGDPRLPCPLCRAELTFQQVDPLQREEAGSGRALAAKNHCTGCLLVLPRGCVVRRNLLLLLIPPPRQVALASFSLRTGQGESTVVPKGALLPWMDQLGPQNLPSSPPGSFSSQALRMAYLRSICTMSCPTQ